MIGPISMRRRYDRTNQCSEEGVSVPGGAVSKIKKTMAGPKESEIYRANQIAMSEYTENMCVFAFFCFPTGFGKSLVSVPNLKSFEQRKAVPISEKMNSCLNIFCKTQTYTYGQSLKTHLIQQ